MAGFARKVAIVQRLIRGNPALMRHPTVRRFCHQHAVVLMLLTGISYTVWRDLGLTAS